MSDVDIMEATNRAAEIDKLMLPIRDADARDHTISIEIYLAATLWVLLRQPDANSGMDTTIRHVDHEGRIQHDFVSYFRNDGEGADVFVASVTHGLAKMAEAVGLYELLWHPERSGIVHARDLIDPLTDGLARLRRDRSRLDPFTPPPRRGNRFVLIDFMESYLVACQDYPQAEVRVRLHLYS